MATSYPIELRQKAVAAVDRGEKKSHVSRMFGISRNTLDQWLHRRVETGSLASKRRSRLGSDPKI
jgi:transposase